MLYKPLPDCLTIKESPIKGLGMFATKDIKKDTELTHTYRSLEWREAFEDLRQIKDL